MAIVETWRSQHYDCQPLEARFVRVSAIWPPKARDKYNWCETSLLGGKRYDVRQGWCGPEDLPDDVRAAADALEGLAWRYVDWPLEAGAH